jgi:Domain of unknown function (DUF4386)
MASYSIDESQHAAARVAGWSYLITFATVCYANFGIHDRLISNSASETARNILAHEQLFRVGIVGDLFYCAGVVVLVTALYVVLRPVSPGIALFAAFLRLIWVLMWLTAALRFFDALRLIDGDDNLRTFNPDNLHSLARAYLDARVDYYYVGLLFVALASIACAYLWFKSGYIPRILAAYGIISSVWAVVCTVAFNIFPNFSNVVNLWWFDMPMGIFDIALSLWLLIKGLPQSRIALPER